MSNLRQKIRLMILPPCTQHPATIWSKEYDFSHSMSGIFMLHYIGLRSIQNILISVLMHHRKLCEWTSNHACVIQRKTGNGWFCHTQMEKCIKNHPLVLRR